MNARRPEEKLACLRDVYQTKKKFKIWYKLHHYRLYLLASEGVSDGNIFRERVREIFFTMILFTTTVWYYWLLCWHA